MKKFLLAAAVSAAAFAVPQAAAQQSPIAIDDNL